MDLAVVGILSFGIPGALAVIAFILFLFSKKMWPWLFRTVEVLSVVCLPVFFLMMDFGQQNDCCNESAYFSPEHRLSAYVVIALCMVAYFYCTWRKWLAPPLIEVLVNCLLIIGIAFNALMIAHDPLPFTWLSGNVPVILLFTMRLAYNHRAFLDQANEHPARNMVEGLCWKLLRAPVLTKFPLFMVLCLPLLALIAGVLMLFGQRPDALVRAFTDTYKHGLSQLDHECIGVVCGGHFLCTVAARGHAQLVRPQRLGVRHGDAIVCNRQLLVSNAFEELIQERAPRLHRFIRGNYDHVGTFVHRHFTWFDRKGVADVIYLLMKPLEWGFLLVLYSCTRDPENRMARQYLSAEHREQIRQSR